MQSSFERKRVLKIMHAEPASVRRVLVQCAAGLAVIALTAVIGYAEHADREAAHPTMAATAAVVQSKRAHEHRKQVFDQRRQRFKGSGEPRRVASEPPDIRLPAPQQ